VPTWLAGVVVMGGSVLLAVAGLALVHRLVAVPVRQPDNEVAGFIYAQVGVLYAVVLAYVTIVVWQQFEAANNTVELEAASIENVYHTADRFPDPSRSAIHQTIRDYVRVTVDEEWPLLADGRSSPRAEDLAHTLQAQLAAVPISSPSEQLVLEHGLRQYQDFIFQRHLRLSESENNVHPVLWGLLILGALVTIGFTYLFGVSRWRLHVVMVAVLTLMVAGMLFMIGIANRPFAGDVHVPDAAFRELVERFTPD
jgi:Protein of unknown function (DUF4239)